MAGHLPPCGGGTGWGVGRLHGVGGSPPPLSPPRKGEGDDDGWCRSAWPSPSLALPTRGRVGFAARSRQGHPPSPLWGGLGRG
ncbi:hypothetical protein [Devosia sp. DBB001]|nr:hypothetical protein [Devosia sp. DBB001]